HSNRHIRKTPSPNVCTLICSQGLILIDLVMDSLLQQRCSMHQSDDVYVIKVLTIIRHRIKTRKFQGSEFARKGWIWQWSWRKAWNFRLGRSRRYTLFTQCLHNVYIMHALHTFATHS